MRMPQPPRSCSPSSRMFRREPAMPRSTGSPSVPPLRITEKPGMVFKYSAPSWAGKGWRGALGSRMVTRGSVGRGAVTSTTAEGSALAAFGGIGFFWGSASAARRGTAATRERRMQRADRRMGAPWGGPTGAIQRGQPGPGPSPKLKGTVGLSECVKMSQERRSPALCCLSVRDSVAPSQSRQGVQVTLPGGATKPGAGPGYPQSRSVPGRAPP